MCSTLFNKETGEEKYGKFFPFLHQVSWSFSTQTSSSLKNKQTRIIIFIKEAWLFSMLGGKSPAADWLINKRLTRASSATGFSSNFGRTFLEIS